MSAATWRPTGEHPMDSLAAGRPNGRRTDGASRRPKDVPNGDAGSERGKSESGYSSPTSGTSGSPSSASKERWRKPRTVKQFAGQINDVATRVLNGEIDMEQARVYSGLVRTVAQSISLEVSKARFLQEAPDLRLDDGDE